MSKSKPRYTKLGKKLLLNYRMARHLLGQEPAQARHTAECLICLAPGGRSNLYAKARVREYHARRAHRGEPWK